MADVIAQVNKYPEGTKAKDVATLLHLEDAQTRVYLRRAVEAGRISNPSRGLYAPVTSVTSVTSLLDEYESNTNNSCNTPSDQDGEAA